ncbi:MAG TPA: chemotaxis protein CheW [Myxococcales bacterium]|jgi:chemotaxis signal transduction protein
MPPESDPQLMQEVARLESELARLRSRVIGHVEREQLPSGPLPLLVFRLGQERVAILHRFVVEVVLMCRLSSIPEAPAWIAGLLNCRGISVPVVDALARLRHASRRPELSDIIVICEVEGRRVGFLVQEILGIETAPSDQLQPPSSDLEHAPYLLGVFQGSERTTLLFSVPALLATSSVPAP